MIYVFDGAMGTMLQTAGLPPGACPELWNLKHPEQVTAIHAQYVAAGADIIETNSFGGSCLKLEHYRLDDRTEAINLAAAQVARAACGSKTLVAGSMGSTGKFLAPLGPLSFDQAAEVFAQQARALAAGGVDYLLLETMIDLQEMRAALVAAKSVTSLPIICQMSFGADGRTVSGTDPVTAAVVLEALGAAVIGANCSLGPEQLLPVASQLAAHTTLPVSIQPNAGMPRLVDGTTLFPMGAEEMAGWVHKLLDAGVSYLGGCCGTTPEHIAALRREVDSYRPEHRIVQPQILPPAITSRSKTVFLGQGYPTAVIGERINPTGRKALAADILAGDFIIVKKEALAQVRAGAAILDVNMGVAGADQVPLMDKAVSELAMLTDAPLSLDTTDAAALEAGLKAFPGKALINSVSAEPERLEEFLPLAKKYGAAVLCLPLEPGGVPATAEERVRVARIIVEAALAAGLKESDLLLDALALTIAAQPDAACQTLKTLRLYRQEFGYPAVMGLSNTSFGLPRRDILNATFCAMSLAAGLDAPILNPYDPLMTDCLFASRALLAQDEGGKGFSISYNITAPVAKRPETSDASLIDQIRFAVEDGEKEAVVPLVKAALAEGETPLGITDKALTEAMNRVGDDFGAGRCFLPQVMLAAEAMRAAFLTIKEALPEHKNESKGKVILATVKGDIHDLGKNIVAALLENNGFTVIDLGKDVPPEAIIDAAREHPQAIVGLCALMTTTLPQIDVVIEALKAENIPLQVLVGGAVLTEEYAYEAGAQAYAPDGVAAVRIVKNMLGVH